MYIVVEIPGVGAELFKSDGTENGTVLVKDINPGSGHSYPYSFTILNNELYFIANNGVNGQELWKTDGTENGTMMVIDLYPGITGGINFMYGYNGLIYMSASTENITLQLFVSNGTEEGTRLLKDI